MSRLIVANGWVVGAGGGGQLVGAKSSVYTGTGADVNISLTDLAGGLASAPAEDDFVLVSYATGGGSNFNMTITTSGYTERCDLYFNQGTIRANLGVFTKFMGVVPDTQVTVGAAGTGSTHVRIQVWRGINLVTPLDVTVVTGGAGGSGQAIVPAITPVTAGAIVIGTAMAAASLPGNMTSMANPGGVYDPFSASKLGGSSSCLGALEWDGSGAEGPFTTGGGSGGNTAYASAALALRPA